MPEPESDSFKMAGYCPKNTLPETQKPPLPVLRAKDIKSALCYVLRVFDYLSKSEPKVEKNSEGPSTPTKPKPQRLQMMSITMGLMTYKTSMMTTPLTHYAMSRYGSGSGQC